MCKVKGQPVGRHLCGCTRSAAPSIAPCDICVHPLVLAALWGTHKGTGAFCRADICALCMDFRYVHTQHIHINIQHTVTLFTFSASTLNTVMLLELRS